MSSTENGGQSDLQAFYDMCAGHDWYYAMSDDDRAFRNGLTVGTKLIALANADSEKQKIYNAWSAHIFHNWPKPERPA